MCINRFKDACMALIAACCLSLVLTACGGGGGGGSATPSAVTISGVAMKGPIAGGTVKVYAATPTNPKASLLVQTSTDASGHFSAQIPIHSGPVLVEVSGNATATQLDEVTGTAKPFTSALKYSAALPDSDSNKTVTISPLSEMAAQYALAAGGLSADNVSGANLVVAEAFQLSDLLAIEPANLTQGVPAGATTAQQQYGLILAGFSQLATTQNVDATQVTQTLANNLATSGSLAPVTAGALGGADLSAAVSTIATQINTAYPTAALATTTINAVTQAITNATTAPIATPDPTDTTPPSTPTGLVATVVNSTSVTITWNASTGSKVVLGYNVFRNGSLVGTTSQPIFTDATVSASTTYSYTVQAYNGARITSGVSAALNVTTMTPTNINVGGQVGGDILGLPQQDIVPPAAPTGLAAQATALTATTSAVALTWVAPVGEAAAGYDIYRNGSKISTSTSAGYTDTVLSGTSYSYYIKAFDAAGNRSVASATVAITPTSANLNISVGGQVQVP